ncbi:hypothetical protein GCM10012275_56170 [Longimycelium tulufanense]|uniref:Uncharacterized protein n=1 Tax=Longimycelium tulufanense TaxID=907463 RepID=A0A8J3CJI5_9PSEU|nr:hypothetical protein [Longimycelium tulufanense]GGM78285.1 hypothetical protein GCM10012275_56170 [Longimycelium tulufanense]
MEPERDAVRFLAWEWSGHNGERYQAVYLFGELVHIYMTVTGGTWLKWDQVEVTRGGNVADAVKRYATEHGCGDVRGAN